MKNGAYFLSNGDDHIARLTVLSSMMAGLKVSIARGEFSDSQVWIVFRKEGEQGYCILNLRHNVLLARRSFSAFPCCRSLLCLINNPEKGSTTKSRALWSLHKIEDGFISIQANDDHLFVEKTGKLGIRCAGETTNDTSTPACRKWKFEAAFEAKQQSDSIFAYDNRASAIPTEAKVPILKGISQVGTVKVGRTPTHVKDINKFLKESSKKKGKVYESLSTPMKMAMVFALYELKGARNDDMNASFEKIQNSDKDYTKSAFEIHIIPPGSRCEVLQVSFVVEGPVSSWTLWPGRTWTQDPETGRTVVSQKTRTETEAIVKRANEIEEKIYKCQRIDDFCNMFDSAEFQAFLSRITKAQTSSELDLDKWAEAWAKLMRTMDINAFILNYDRHVCLELIFTLCKRWKEEKVVSEEDIVQRFGKKRMEAILVPCVVMDRAQSLFMMQITPGVYGIHWHRKGDKLGVELAKSNYNNGRAPQNKRYKWLMEECEGLGLQQNPQLVRWLEPEMVPEDRDTEFLPFRKRGRHAQALLYQLLQELACDSQAFTYQDFTAPDTDQLPISVHA